jgi:hypothetical protein
LSSKTRRKSLDRKSKTKYVEINLETVVIKILTPSRLKKWYTPTKFVEVLLEHVPPTDYCKVIKVVSAKGYIPVKYQVVLRHIQFYKKGIALP